MVPGTAIGNFWLPESESQNPVQSGVFTLEGLRFSHRQIDHPQVRSHVVAVRTKKARRHCSPATSIWLLEKDGEC